MRLRARALALLAVLALTGLLGAGTAAAVTPVADATNPAYRAAKVFATGESVYVDRGLERVLDRIAADQVRGKIIRTGGDPIYVAVLPGNPDDEKVADRQLKDLTQFMNPSNRSTIVVVTGGRMRAASTAIPYADARQFAEEAITAHQADPLEVQISDFITRLGKELGRSDSGGTGGVITGVVVSIVVFAGVGILLLRRRRRWRELDVVRALVEDDIAALEREPRTLPEPEASSVREPVARAGRRLKRARGVEHLPAVAADLAEARRALVVARAELAGEVPPAPRADCFFDARHGASAFDVEWAPAGGAAARTVPACSTCAQRVKNGLEPAGREVERAEGARAPWWEGGPELAFYLAPRSRELLAGLPAGRPLRTSRWKP